MRIEEVQPNQPNFGTKVQMSFKTAKAIVKNDLHTKIFAQINALERNGKDDIMILSMDKNSNNKIIAKLVQYANGKKYKSKFSISTNVVTELDNGKRQFVNLYTMYGRLENLMTQTATYTKGMVKLLPYVV